MERAEVERAFGVVLAAAGTGRRFGSKKQFLQLLGRPLLHYGLDAFCALSSVLEVVVVVPSSDVRTAEGLTRSWLDERSSASPDPRITVIAGGARRQDSVLLGTEALGEAVQWVLVHDAARPLIRTEDVVRVIEAVREFDAAVLGYPATDSIKEVSDGNVVHSLPREPLWQVQTPQAARRRLLLDAYRKAGTRSFTDEVGLLAQIGVMARAVEGSRDNMKVTSPGDEALAEFLLRRRLTDLSESL